MGDFIELIIFLAVVFISLLAGGKKRSRSQQRSRPGQPPQRPQARPVRRPQPAPERTRPEPRLTPAPKAAAGEPTRHSVAQEILQLLGAQLEEEAAPQVAPPPAPQRREAAALDDYRREAVSLERPPREARGLDTVEPSRKREHAEFHERYVDAAAEQGPRRRASRYHRLTPRTAREAVIWKTIFSPPKALE